MPLVIVTAEGGGIRAAFWTASALGALCDFSPGTENQIFGLSGVSGGSLGIAVFAALIRDRSLLSPQDLAATSKADSLGLGYLQRKAWEVLGNDGLAPSLYSMTTSDLVGAALGVESLVRREAALERGFEHA